MGAGLRPEAGMECLSIADGGLDALPVEHLFRLVEVRHALEFILLIRVEESHFEGKRGFGKPVRCLERFDRTAASCILPPGKRARLTARPGITGNRCPDRAPL